MLERKKKGPEFRHCFLGDCRRLLSSVVLAPVTNELLWMFCFCFLSFYAYLFSAISPFVGSFTVLLYSSSISKFGTIKFDSLGLCRQVISMETLSHSLS